MKIKFAREVLCSLAALWCVESSAAQATTQADPTKEELHVIRPGEPGVRPFWNTHSGRFIYAPAFEFKEVPGAAHYRFRATARREEFVFTAAHPWDSLVPIWPRLPEGLVELVVEALDKDGNRLGEAGRRTFYRSPSFQGMTSEPALSYVDAGRQGLRALFIASHVQHWVTEGGPDRSYDFYCYPAKVEGALIRAMVEFAQFEPEGKTRKEALRIAELAAEHLISISMAKGTPFQYWPPTYRLDVQTPKPAAREAFKKKWMMTSYACDAAFGYLDLYQALRSEKGNEALAKKFYDAAVRIADTYAQTQGSDGTWPLLVNFETGKPEAPNRLAPTWPIFLLDRLEREHGLKQYRSVRDRAWKYLEQNPLKTFAWDAQFEDTKPRPAYRNLAREQACDVATILFQDPASTPEQLDTARELLRFGEDQFVVWSKVKDPAGWKQAKLERSLEPAIWIPPLVLEQYTCYMPVARSSAVFIKAYLAGYKATRDPVYLQKAKALANGLVEGQQDQIQNYGGKGEIPTWLVRKAPKNWLNNSFYAADALLMLARAETPRNTN